MDSFIEHMIKQKKKGSAIVKSILAILGCLFAMLVATLVFFFILPPVVISLWTLCIAGIIYGTYKIIQSFDVEYEYILTNGELDVDKITHKKKRKRLITIHSKTFLEFGKIEDFKNSIHKDEKFANVIDASANSQTHQDYYAIFFKNGQKIKLVFNPSQKMIDVFKIYAPRVVM